MSKKKKLLFIQLNEINFDFISSYLLKGKELPNFKKIVNEISVTESETEYQNLEPWIQWVSIFTGKKFKEHNIFRLGDIVNHDYIQLYEELEKKGYSVGAISPMNCKNNLKKSEYFIPDPWTNTISSGGLLAEFLHKSLKQTVNDNSTGKIELKSYLMLFYCIITTFKFSDLIKLPAKVLFALKKSWRKAIFLDEVLHKIHLFLIKKFRPDLSSIFFNAGAHIQHHYFHSSEVIDSNISNPSWYIDEKSDPLFEVLKTYDRILGEYLNLNNFGYEILICTGLSQVSHSENQFYYRLRNHRSFFDFLSIPYKSIQPRMTRDFLVKFKNNKQANEVKSYLQSLSFDKKQIFGLIDIRDNELFITLDYNYEINEKSIIECPNFQKTELVNFDLFDHISFVAIKNGKHSSKGYLYRSYEKKSETPINIIDINAMVLNFFKA
tara:strand:+ start:5630 stop:6940 length:1311 start_codon:yes stop_codon:yes gene_type:complete